MNKIQNKLSSGFTLVELLIVLAIMAILTTIVFNSFISFRNKESLSKDTENIVAMLREARNQTLSSKNSSPYGVYFSATSTALFIGTTYSSGTSTNKVFILSDQNTISAINLNGGGSSVVFKRLSGETSNSGTITLFSPQASSTKVVTIYKTGLVE